MAFECKQICKTYKLKQGELVALKDVTFTVREQEFLCIVGPSGCGKTTLLKIIAGLITPTSGQINFSQENRSTSPRSAMVFQDLGLFPWMTIRENVAFGLETRGENRKDRLEKADALLETVGLGAFKSNYPYQLSGGMRQRTAILRAFLTDPQILLMDEPFGALDSQTRLIMQEELLRIWKDHRKTVLYVTHDLEEAVMLADRILVMSGRPATIQADLSVNVARPRQIADRDHPEVEKIRWQIWKMIESEVRQELGV